MSTYLEEAVEKLSTVPVDLQRFLSLISDLDEGSAEELQRLKTLQDKYLNEVKNKLRGLPREPGADLRGVVEDVEKREEIESLRNSALQKAEEKITVAKQAYDLLDQQVRDLDKQLLSFEDELVREEGFDTRMLPPGTQLRNGVVPGGIGSDDAKSRAREFLEGGPVAASPAPKAYRETEKHVEVPLTYSAPVHQQSSGGVSVPSSVPAYAPGAPADLNQYMGHASSRATIPSAAAASSAAAVGGPVVDTVESSSPAPQQYETVPPVEPSAAAAAGEELYCYCNRPSFGQMIGCDYEKCPVGNGWFHIGCLNITEEPEGAWYCPDCVSLLGFADSSGKKKSRKA